MVHVVVSGAFAGVEAHVARLARAQAERGDRVVVVGGDVGRVRQAAGPGVRVHPGASLREAWASLAALRAGADVLHAHMTAAELLAVAAAGAPTTARHLPVVATRHFAQVRGRSLPGRVASRMIRPRLAAQVAISRYVADAVGEPSVVVPPGVGPAGADALGGASPPRAADREPVVLMVQRLEPEKRTDLGVRAFAASGLAARGWRLDVAGDGSLRDDLARLVSRSGLTGSVRLLGERRDVAARMGRAALLLAPCPAEGLGLSVLEAMAAGLPVVAADAGGHVETLGGLDPAALWRPGDADDGGRCLAVLAASPARRDVLADAALDRQRSGYTPAAQATATDAVYRDALHRAAARRSVRQGAALDSPPLGSGRAS
ncbi:glycosyltransferase family 4 protein [Isoptericola sp. 4D.3]|uniref:D-inositol 3-phosphate glycosyltransferase n=1 Tax=Isoptericola peretonis TaxID=2918523 RepID=A0ABT0J5S4_9MICO|nr:glycosyltransferase family 4 protein [Isoptericola sp. 4D.3]